MRSRACVSIQGGLAIASSVCERERESARAARTGVPLYVSMSLDFCFLAHLARFALCTTALLYQFYIDVGANDTTFVL